MRTSNAFNLGMVAVLAACTAALGPLAMAKLYLVPYWVNVVWLDVVTYLHHHGPQDAGEKIPWYRGKVCPTLGRQPAGGWSGGRRLPQAHASCWLRCSNIVHLKPCLLRTREALRLLGCCETS